MPMPNSNVYTDIVGTGLTLIESEDGGAFLIDTCNRALAEGHCWGLHEHGYADARWREGKEQGGKMRHVYLHRLICRPTADRPDVDHKNRSNWDCREENLRACTVSQNQCNQKIRSDNASGAKGVGLHRATGKFRARVKIRGVERHLGLFVTLAEADATVRAARKEFHQEFARHE